MSSRHDGFSLLEVVVAIAIMGTGAVSALALTGNQLRTVQKAQEYLVAVSLADLKLSELQLESRSARAEPRLSGKFETPFDDYIWTATFVQTADNGLGVTVGIRWQGGSYNVATVMYVRTPLDGRP